LKHLSLLGSTGSIGQQTLDIVGSHPKELKVVALAAGARQLPLLAEQIRTFAPSLVSVPTADDAQQLLEILDSFGPNGRKVSLEIMHGD